jgi:energy-coupling factor transport system permease protein
MIASLPFRRINPLTKLTVALTYVGFVTVSFDIAALGALLALAVLALMAGERLPPIALARNLAPFALAGLGFLWVHVFFGAEADAYAQSLPNAPVAPASTLTGIAMLLRALCFGAFSYFFVRTTDPGDLVRALMQHARLPPHLAYSVFAAIQFLPSLGDELRQIERAHALTTGRPVPPGRWSIRRRAGYALPLLASTVRRATRAAISMECRGLAPGLKRTSLRPSTFGRGDVVFAVGATAALVAAIAW